MVGYDRGGEKTASKDAGRLKERIMVGILFVIFVVYFFFKALLGYFK